MGGDSVVAVCRYGQYGSALGAGKKAKDTDGTERTGVALAMAAFESLGFAFREQSASDYGIDAHLEEKFRPLGFDGENVGDDIIVDWSATNDLVAKQVSRNRLSKEEYFARVMPIIEELKSLLGHLEACLVALDRGGIDKGRFRENSAKARSRAGKLYSEVSRLPVAPFECRDLDKKLGIGSGHLDNIEIYYADRNRMKWEEGVRLLQSLSEASNAREAPDHLEYELAKIR